jgi:hypothetical protein
MRDCWVLLLVLVFAVGAFWYQYARQDALQGVEPPPSREKIRRHLEAIGRSPEQAEKEGAQIQGSMDRTRPPPPDRIEASDLAEGNTPSD